MVLEKSGVAGVGGKVASGCRPSSVGGNEDVCDCVRLISVTGGGLHKS